MSAGLIFLFILGLVAVIAISLYNGLVAKQINVENAWSQIDVQLKRRHDLIPNLVETVKGYATHEREALEAVVKARSSAVQVAGAGATQQVPAENQLTQALGRLFALAESYPDLKANSNFQALQEELSSTENRIGFARQHYNDSVSIFRTARLSFPSNILASIFSFQDKPFFELDPAEHAAAKQPPQVKF